MEAMNTSALVKSINFHGQTLHKLCENVPVLQEALSKSSKELNYKEFSNRQKHLRYVYIYIYIVFL